MSKAMGMFFFALFAGVLALAAGAYGNNVFAQEENREKKAVVTTFGGPGIGAVGGPGVSPAKNAPFSAELASESIQTLADGNRIVHRTNTMIYSDGEGRIRRETSFKIRDASGAYKEHKTIQVSDSFGGLNFILDPQNRTARKFPTRPMKEIAGVRTLPNVSVGGAPNGAAILGGNVVGPGPVKSVAGFGVQTETKNESLGSQMIEGVAA